MYYNAQSNFIQSTPFPGALIFPESFMPIYYSKDKRASGFVKITDNGTTVTSCMWDEEAYQQWCADNPEPDPDPDPEPTEIEQLRAQVADLQNQILTMRLGG